MKNPAARQTAFSAAGGDKGEPETHPEYEEREDPGTKSKRRGERRPIADIPERRNTCDQPSEKPNSQEQATLERQQMHVSL